MRGGLKLRAVDDEDLGVVSACLQDGLIALCDMEYLPEERRFILVANRFRWEDCAKLPDGHDFERVHCGLCFEAVTRVRLRNIDRRDRGRVLELLAIKPQGKVIDLLFAERGRVRLEVERILCHVQDLDEPWPTPWRPQHVLAERE